MALHRSPFECLTISYGTHEVLMWYQHVLIADLCVGLSCMFAVTFGGVFLSPFPPIGLAPVPTLHTMKKILNYT